MAKHQGSCHRSRIAVEVDIRCLSDIDLEAIPIEHFDGRSL